MTYIDEMMRAISVRPLMYAETYGDAGFLWCTFLVFKLHDEDLTRDRGDLHTLIHDTHRHYAREVLDAKGPRASEYWPEDIHKFRTYLVGLEKRVREEV